MLNIQGGWQSMGTAILLKFAKNFGVAPSLVSKKTVGRKIAPGKIRKRHWQYLLYVHV